MRLRKITIISTHVPSERTLNEELQWFGKSLGLFGERDKDKSCYRIFLELLKEIKTSDGLTSDQLAEKLNLTRPTVIHHLNALIERGLIIHDKNRYVVRQPTLARLIEDLQKDAERSLNELKEMAQELDRILRL